MKVLNLVMAIVYTVIYGIILLIAMSDSDMETVIGLILLSGPVVVNWITWSYLKNNK